MKKTVGMLSLGIALAAMNLITVPGFAANSVVDKNVQAPIKLCDFAPKNNKKIPLTKGMIMEGLDEAMFNKVIDDFLKVFTPIVKSHNAKLVINRKWSDGTVNSDTTVSGKTWEINAYGGLARYKGMNYDAYAAVLSHELGHHLGGFPRKPGIFGSSWASNEGEADYFATMKGFRIFMKNEDNSTAVSTLSIPQTVSDQCAQFHKSSSEIALCQRESMAGLYLAQVLNELGEGTTPVAFDTPDTHQVSRTNDDHPAAQCRLDTYFNGSICGMSMDEEFSPDEPTKGACAEEKGDKVGVRSRCWYKPKL